MTDGTLRPLPHRPQPTFIVVPFLSLLFGLHPVVVDRWFAISGTAYYISIYLVQNYCRWAAGLAAAAHGLAELGGRAVLIMQAVVLRWRRRVLRLEIL